MKLNLGCGRDYKEGYVNVDINKSFKTDYYLDLNKELYLLPSNQFEEIVANNIIEHLDNPIDFLKELIRISRNGGVIKIKVCHAFSYANVTDIQHKTNFTENSFSFDLLEEYGLTNIELMDCKFTYAHGFRKFIPFKRFFKIFFNGIYDDINFTFRVLK